MKNFILCAMDEVISKYEKLLDLQACKIFNVIFEE